MKKFFVLFKTIFFKKKLNNKLTLQDYESAKKVLNEYLNFEVIEEQSISGLQCFIISSVLYKHQRINGE